MQLSRSLSHPVGAAPSLMLFNKLFKCMIDDVATACRLQLQSSAQSISSDLQPQRSSWKVLRRFVNASRVPQPELPTRANCCLKMRQCNYTNENASWHSTSGTSGERAYNHCHSICMLFTAVLRPASSAAGRLHWLELRQVGSTECTNALWNTTTHYSLLSTCLGSMAPISCPTVSAKSQLLCCWTIPYVPGLIWSSMFVDFLLNEQK